ncbi:hypothetical protein DERP_008871 [Dermatophagoides pteronyssinus]|uniref:Uncharacterized protein n=1 Tax=Dermatophagoides pteronyssinus TaxID=6956 RepID=A0ABQ8JNL8_DERPT|nr:hypothetical protein DERP_008871 [Dermatophagoides pteronyssinus]
MLSSYYTITVKKNSNGNDEYWKKWAKYLNGNIFKVIKNIKNPHDIECHCQWIIIDWFNV